MADGVVGDEKASGNHAREDEVVGALVEVFFGIEEAEGDVGLLREMLESVAGDEVDEVGDGGEFEGLAGEGELGGINLIGSDAAVGGAGGEGEPEGGVSSAGADLDDGAGGGRGGEEGDEASSLGRNLAETTGVGSAVGAVAEVDGFEVLHAGEHGGGDGFEHGGDCIARAPPICDRKAARAAVEGLAWIQRQR